MNVQHDTSIVVRKPLARHIDDTPLQRILRRKGDGVDDEIELAPLFGDAFEHCLHLARRVDVERHHNRCFKFARERLNIFLGFVVEIGHGKLGAERAERLGAAPGDRVLVGDADNKPSFAFKKLGFHSGYHCRVLLAGVPGGLRSVLRSFIGLSKFYNVISATSLRHHELCLGGREDLRHRYSGRCLTQNCSAIGKRDDCQFGDDQIYWTKRRKRQSAFLDDLGFTLSGVLHRDDDALGAGYQVHRAAHARHHLSRDHPVRQLPGLIDLQSAEHGQINMTAANKTKRHCAVERAGARERRDRATAGVGQSRMRHALFGRAAGANQAVLRLEENMHVLAGT